MAKTATERWNQTWQRRIDQVMAKFPVTFKGLSVSMTPLDQKFWRIEDEFSFISIQQSLTIIVPAGFITDFASVPRALWMIYPRWGTYGYAAIVHDLLYKDVAFKGSRLMADKIFYEAMLELGVPDTRASILYYAVRIFGSFAWGHHPKRIA